jgi:hypothetical protein
MIHPFYRTRLIYQICSYIAQHREQLLKELVAYTDDSVRYRRRMRMLKHLAAYEQATLEKMQNFETQDQSDLEHADVIGQLKQEVDSIVHRSA